MSAVCVVSPTVAGNTILTTNPLPIIAISPSGVLAWSDNLTVGGVAGGSPGYAGLIQPLSPVDTSKIVAGKYAGIAIVRSLPVGGSSLENGQPVAFGPAAAGGTGLSGGFFPSNDITQTPGGIVIDLGTQDAKYNGLYTNATVTLSGQPLSAVAVAGTVGNKNLIYVAAVGTPTTTGVLYLFLYGQ